LLFGKRNAKHDRRVSNLISSVDVFKLLFMLPQSRTQIPSWHLEAEAARRRYGERLAAQVRTYKCCSQKKRDVPRRHQILLKSVMCDCDLEFMPKMNLMANDIFMMSSLLFPPGRKRFNWRRRLFSGEIAR
jgi:hypothetical protein